MASALRIISAPLRLGSRLTVDQLALCVAADAVRRANASDDVVGSWLLTTMAGDLEAQAAVERDLARRGLDRLSLGREAFVERVRSHEATARAQAAADLREVAAEVDLSTGAGDAAVVVGAAHTGFVRLYEAGLLHEEERVVELCTRCGSVVERADAELCEVPATTLEIGFGFADESGHLDVTLIASELIPGAVAVAVPEGDESVGRSVRVPLVGRTVPVVADPGRVTPGIVVPGHDADSLEIARRHGLAAEPVVDVEGTVTAEPLQGLARYAARAVATELLEAEGVLSGRVDSTETVRRCRSCGVVLLPQLGRHWFLEMADLHAAAAEAVLAGAISFVPESAEAEMLEASRHEGAWCLSHQLWAGLPVPVSVCTDCGRLEVSVMPHHSCGKCMGTLVPYDSVLDARFVGALWPLAAAGWPNNESKVAELAPDTVLMTHEGSVDRWVLPMVALGRRLSGTVPFTRVALVPVVSAPHPDDIDPLVSGQSPSVARLALLAGDLDVQAARRLADAVGAHRSGGAEVAGFSEEFIQRMERGDAAGALASLTSFVARGASDPTRASALSACELRDVAAPLLAE